ncbi:MAG: hypothetical protein QGF59_27895, partial [Pirellulaceae bacterium]|nr:hypothetical protein [Pirellulaceae bacterium]
TFGPNTSGTVQIEFALASLGVAGSADLDGVSRSGGGSTGGGSNEILYTSFATTTSVPGVGLAADDDILAYDTVTGAWSTYIDGSDIGLSGTDINAFSVLPDGSVIFSINSATFSLPGLIGGPSGNTITENDLVRFVPTSTGTSTAGTFVFYLDGSDIGFSSGSTDIDGVHVDASGLIYLSLAGHASITGLNWVGDEDVLLFTPTTYGANSSGTWSLHFDGSDMGFNASSTLDIDGFGINASNELLFSTAGAMSVGGIAGADEDVGAFTGTFGSTTSGSLTLTHVLANFGISSSADVDGIHR